MIRADRADGIYLRNFKVEFSDFNNIYVLETNGFRIDEIVSRYSREYGILSFTSDHGIYENCEASLQRRLRRLPGLRRPTGARHPTRTARTGSISATATRTTTRSGCPARPATAPGRTTTASTTTRPAVTTDSFAGRAPRHAAGQLEVVAQPDLLEQQGLLQRRARRLLPQHAPSEERDPTMVCPTFQVPVGTGILIAGGNANIVEENYIFDNWRDGHDAALVPAALRGEPEKGIHVSFDNLTAARPAGRAAGRDAILNGNDFSVGRAGPRQQLGGGTWGRATRCCPRRS